MQTDKIITATLKDILITDIRTTGLESERPGFNNITFSARYLLNFTFLNMCSKSTILFCVSFLFVYRLFLHKHPHDYENNFIHEQKIISKNAFQPLNQPENVCTQEYDRIKPGAYCMQEYLPLIKGKKIGVVTNQTGIIYKTHLVDTLLKLNISIKKIFSPEHGFRGQSDAGVKVDTRKDSLTGIPVVSLYGKKLKPSAEDLKNIDILIFDIQDVGVRFYTYLSTLHYVMEACAEQKKLLIVLDRPNPNGFYIDGPVMKKEYRSFLGLHPVPVVYGMTIGEYALMINGEGWLSRKIKCRLKVIPCENYQRKCTVKLPVPPSPNLNSFESVLLYPTLGLLEGSIACVGRGTSRPFCSITHPDYPDTGFCITPVPNSISHNPKYSGQRCCGVNLLQDEYLIHHPHQLNLSWIRNFALRLKKENFFNEHFEAHAGNAELRHQLMSRIRISDIRSGWEQDLTAFKNIRKKYLIYPDFE